MKWEALVFGAVAPAIALAGNVTNFNASTTNGLIIGHRSDKRPNVIEYLGIPYAQPPVDDLRFAPPQKYEGQGTYVAANYGFDCYYTPSGLVDYPDKTPQFDSIFEAFAAVNNNTQSEDCLTLNIWSKDSSTQSKPVLVHFYGGRWTSGTTHTPFYYGGYLADAQDIIVVTVNYRMNIFGFPGIPGQPPNPGLLDQRMAVEWVRDNIKAFGGDPSRITISGQSCGSASVDYWAYAYKSDPIVAGLISHSGTVFSFPVNTPDEAAQHWYNASELLGCGSSGDVLPCMRQKSADDIKAAAAQVKVPNTNPARKAPAFQPTVDNVTVFENYTTLSASGQFARVPYLLGNDDNEAGFYKIAAYAQGANLTEAQWQQFNYETFTCPSRQEAINHVNAGVPAWRFRYCADWDNTRLYPISGAYHGVDMNMIFGNSQDVTGLPESQAQLQLQQTMQAAWASFVSNPTEGLTKLGWPVFDPNSMNPRLNGLHVNQRVITDSGTENSLIRLGYENKPEAAFVNPEIYDNVC